MLQNHASSYKMATCFQRTLKFHCISLRMGRFAKFSSANMSFLTNLPNFPAVSTESALQPTLRLIDMITVLIR